MVKGRKKKRAAHKTAGELERYKTVTRMMGGFIHQLRTPIHIIQSSAEDLATQRRFMPNFRPQAQLILRSAQRLETSVNTLLNFIKGAKLTLRPGLLNDALSLLGDFIKDECRKRAITVDQQLRSQKSILLDPHYLQEAVLNLLMNALEAMPKGGTLTVRTADVPQGVTLHIQDTGEGMSPAQLAKLAKPFQTTKKSGMGLGVFFTRKILNQHRGKLSFSSHKGKGTTVTISFPAI